MSYTFELNNERRDASFVSGKINANSPVVEVFSAMTDGKELAKFGKKGDAAAKYIKELNSRAATNDQVAISEINELRRFKMQPVLMQEIKLLGIYGNYKPIGYNESCEVEITEYVNTGAEIQAAGQDVKFPTIRKRRVPIATTTISGGYAVDYRKAALGDMSDENELQEQVRTDIRNKAAKYVVDETYKAVKNIEMLLKNVEKVVKSDEANLLDRVEKMVETIKENSKELEELKSRFTQIEAQALAENSEVINGVTVIMKTFKTTTADDLRKMVDYVKDKMTNTVVVLASGADKAIFAAGVTKELTSKVKAGNLVKEAAVITGGNGGGRPDFAQAGGKDATKIQEAMNAVKETLKNSL